MTATSLHLQQLAERISFPGLRIQIQREDGRDFLRVVNKLGTCNETGAEFPWNGRKWRLSPHMTDMEVVNTAFLAILTAQEHEARELFRVDGVALMDSHRDLAQVLAFMRVGGGHTRVGG